MNRQRAIFTFLLLVIIVVGVVACESHDLEVRNKTDEVIVIYVDKFYEGAAAPDNYLLIRHLSRGAHHIEILDLEEDEIVDYIIYLDDDSKLVVYESYFRSY